MPDIAPRDRRPQRVALLAGDGIGPEVVAVAEKVLQAVARRFELPLELEHFPWGADHYLATGETLPEGALEMLRRECSAILAGAFGDPRVPSNVHARDILLGLRFGLDLYIGFRPVRLYDQRLCPLAGRTPAEVEMVVFRESTEGAYVGIGGTFRRDTPEEMAVDEAVHTRRGIERILRAAFEHASAAPRRRLCLAHKANALEHGHGLWRRCFDRVAEEFPQVEARTAHADAVALEMVAAPQGFDVIVADNLFGDLLSDIGAALQGGPGVAASANLHPGRPGLFEPVHGSAPDLAGSGRANPVATVLSAVLLLRDLGHELAAAAVEEAVTQTLRQGWTTPDLGGELSTAEVGDRLLGLLRGGF